MQPSTLTVFVSSTSEDLLDFRKVAGDVIDDLHWTPRMQEHFDTQPGTIVQSCREMLDGCDLMLLFVAWRKGWTPAAEQGGNGSDSITAIELAYAREKDIPVLAFLADKSWPGDLYDHDEAKYRWLISFREGLNQFAVPFYFEAAGPNPRVPLPQFRAVVERALLAHKERLLRAQETSRPPADLARIQSARDALLAGDVVPVLGCGIYGPGPLCPGAIALSLLARPVGRKESPWNEMPLATAAEYREGQEVSRKQFLQRLRGTIDRACAGNPASPVLDLLCGIKNLSLVVSVSYEGLLEQRFRDAGRRYVVAAHVLRSRDHKWDGYLLVKRPGKGDEFVHSDKLDLEPGECLIYKPVGAPYLHDGIDPKLDIDTVVITETDHALFLQRLESHESGVPEFVRSQFRYSPLLFLGYTMDSWQYRLMMQVFQSSGRQDRHAETFAVRTPAGDLEDSAWRGIKATLIRMNLEDFARAAATTGGA